MTREQGTLNYIHFTAFQNNKKRYIVNEVQSPAGALIKMKFLYSIQN